MPLGRHALRVVQDELKNLFWGYMGGRYFFEPEGLVKMEEFASWVSTIYPDQAYYWEEALTIDIWDLWMREYGTAAQSGFRAGRPR